MIVREVLAQEKESFNRLASHPLQSWEWGEFREKTGVKVVRLGAFEGRNLIAGYQVTIHPIPHISYTIIYFPKGPMPNKAMLEALVKLGEQEKTIFVKIEPQVILDEKSLQSFDTLISQYPNLLVSSRPLFTKYTFQIDLTKSEEELLAQMKEKTRYNIRLAQKHGVVVKEDNSTQAFENYLRLTRETTQRQKFYAHDERYHRLMWQTLHPAGIAHLLLAQLPTTNDQRPTTLVAWVVFSFNKVLYYPYGASSTAHRELMASNLMMWEAIRFGKKMGCHTFDMWGSLGPNPDPHDPWYGFHRFKEGYGGKLVEFVGSYDLVLKPTLYRLYNFADNLRWKFLRIRKQVSSF